MGFPLFRCDEYIEIPLEYVEIYFRTTKACQNGHDAIRGVSLYPVIKVAIAKISRRRRRDTRPFLLSTLPPLHHSRGRGEIHLKYPPRVIRIHNLMSSKWR